MPIFITKFEMMQSVKKRIIILSIGILLMLFNLSKTDGIENVKAIHAVSLLTMGALAGLLIMNIFMAIKQKKD